ncbi:type III pantothenate kinase [Bacteroidota bacterium]
MNLVIDIGNTAFKAAVFKSGEMISSKQWDETDNSGLIVWLEAHTNIQKAIISSVRTDDAGISAVLKKLKIQQMILDEHTPLPLINSYKSATTLGRDRIAAAVGANSKFPGQDLLIIDAGTAITIDFVSSDNEYLGGNISPGLSMRFRSLHEFTDNLPLLVPADIEDLLGNDTESAILAGVQHGIIFELDEYINRQKTRYPDLQVIITGGDAMFFDKKLKNHIFVDLNLNLYGLYRILDYNVGR